MIPFIFSSLKILSSISTMSISWCIDSELLLINILCIFSYFSCRKCSFLSVSFFLYEEQDIALFIWGTRYCCTPNFHFNSFPEQMTINSKCLFRIFKIHIWVIFIFCNDFINILFYFVLTNSISVNKLLLNFQVPHPLVWFMNLSFIHTG